MVLLLPTLLSLLSATFAATLTVDASGSGGAYTTIMAAVAVSSDGDEIDVAAGTYAECIDPGGRSLVFVGAGSAVTTIDGGGACSFTLLVAHGEVTTAFSGFTVLNTTYSNAYFASGVVDLEDVVLTGGGSAASPVGNLSVGAADVTFTDSEISHSGGGRSITLTGGGSLTLTDTSVSDNDEGAIYASGSAGEVTLNLNRATIADNHARTTTAGVEFYGPGALNSSGSTFTRNRCDSGSGGALYLSGGELVSAGDVFVDGEVAKTAALGGEIYLEFADARFSDTSIQGGAASLGAGVYVNGGSVGFLRGDISWNSATNGGGGIYACRRAEVITEGTLIEGNTSANVYDNVSEGGGALIYGAYLSDIGGVWRSNAGSHGGALSYYVNVRSDGLSLTDTEFTSNTAWNGGALYAYLDDEDLSVTNVHFSGNSATYDGGAVYVATDYRTSISFSGSAFRENTASVGGAVRLDGTVNVQMGECEFTENAATETGGALSVSQGADVSIQDSRFNHNSADGDPGDGGGAIYVSRSRASVSRSVFCGNVASSGGGAYIVSPLGTPDWKNNVFQENTAVSGAGVYFEATTDAEFVNNSLVGNSSSGGGGGLYFASSSGRYTNNIIAYQSSGFGEFAYDGASGVNALTTWSDFYANIPADLGGTFVFSTTADGNTTADPGFIRYSADGDCTNDLLGLSATSPLIDAGDPSILDLDGTVSDIGATGGPDAAGIDADHDGYLSDVDCNDTNAAVNPESSESCNDIDDDCDGVVDGATLDVGTPWYADADGDGFGDPLSGALACTAPEGGITDGTDCDDGDALAFPGASEVPYDGIDQDCSGADLTDVDADDYDADAVGGADCDDANAAISPSSAEVPYDGIDQDCSGADLTDVDADGYDAAAIGGDDCDDTNPAVSPLAFEVPDDGVDQDCDGADGYSDSGDAGTGGACGCAVGAPGAASPFALLVALALARRRAR